MSAAISEASTSPSSAGVLRSDFRRRIKQAGISDIPDHRFGRDFGGAWYWNWYPGIQCDTDSCCYLPARRGELLFRGTDMPTVRRFTTHSQRSEGISA